MPTIHPTAIVSRDAELADSVQIGPGCVITGRVTLGEGVRLVANVHIAGPATIGAGTIVYPSACLGYPPQDYKFGPEDPTAGVVIGADCIIREGVTVHAASNDHTPTRIGDHVLMMVNSHAGHDVQIGDHTILVNGTVIGGHAQIAERVNISGNCAIHQFVRVGRLAMISGGVAFSMDVPPFCLMAERNRLSGINLVGLRRSGMDRADIAKVRAAFKRVFYAPLERSEQVEILTELAEGCAPVGEMLEFVKTAKKPIAGGPLKPPLSAQWTRALLKGEVALDTAEEH